MTSNSDITTYVDGTYNPSLETPEQYVARKAFRSVTKGTGQVRQDVARDEASKLYREYLSQNFVELPFIPLGIPQEEQQPEPVFRAFQESIQPPIIPEPEDIQPPEEVQNFARKVFNALRGLFS